MRASRTGPQPVILSAGDPGWDDARRAWDLVVDQRPAAVAVTETSEDPARF
jgi:hypothetical protein